MTLHLPFSIIGFLAAIVAANVLTTEYGLIDVGLGLTATAGTFMAGFCFVLRDAVQDTGGRRLALAVIAMGGLISYVLADPFIAVASVVAFTVSEIVDMAIYTPLRDHGYIRAALASNITGAFVDTILFLWIAGFPIWDNVAGQMYVKTAVTLLVVAGVVTTRAVLRNTQQPASP